MPKTASTSCAEPASMPSLVASLECNPCPSNAQRLPVLLDPKVLGSQGFQVEVPVSDPRRADYGKLVPFHAVVFPKLIVHDEHAHQEVNANVELQDACRYLLRELSPADEAVPNNTIHIESLELATSCTRVLLSLL